MATLKIVKYEMECSTVMIVHKQMEKQDLEETNRDARDNVRRRRRRARDNQNTTENPSGANASSSLNSTISTSNQTGCVYILK
jgi:predicted  nucleic acid-binding Zn-ribbon protein